MNKILIQFKREFWESRASFLHTPLYLGGLVMALLLFGSVTSKHTVGQAIQQMQGASGESQNIDADFLGQLMSGELFTTHPEILSHGLAAIYTVFFLVLLLVLQPYLLSALYSDRRDQSILFWKSLPVSERQNVLTKLGAAVLAAPLFYGAAALLTGALYLVALIVTGLFLDFQLPGFGEILGTYFGSIASLVVAWLLLALWALPIFSWLLFSSALAKKAPFLMALGVPLVLAVLEFWVFGSCYLGCAISDQIQASLAVFAAVLPHPEQIGVQLAQTFAAPALWVGLLISVLLLSGSIWLRSYRYEI